MKSEIAVAKIDEILAKLKDFENELKALKNDLINNESNKVKKQGTFGDFEKFLVDVKKLNKKSINNYYTSLKIVKKMIKNFLNVDLSAEIFEIRDQKYILKLASDLYENINFIEKNRKAHNTFTAALNNYIDFLKAQNSEVIFED